MPCRKLESDSGAAHHAFRFLFSLTSDTCNQFVEWFNQASAVCSEKASAYETTHIIARDRLLSLNFRSSLFQRESVRYLASSKQADHQPSSKRSPPPIV
jgi:hypothetical protein